MKAVRHDSHDASSPVTAWECRASLSPPSPPSPLLLSATHPCTEAQSYLSISILYRGWSLSKRGKAPRRPSHPAALQRPRGLRRIMAPISQAVWKALAKGRTTGVYDISGRELDEVRCTAALILCCAASLAACTLELQFANALLAVTSSDPAAS